MKSKKNWYTLLEIMIVLGVIIIIMTITMKFSSSRIDDLNAQTSKDDFKNNYEQLLLSNMSSNYHNWERYDSLTITMQSWTNGFTYLIENEWWETKTYTGYTENRQIITRILTNDEEQSALKIQLTPYKIWCRINNEETTEAMIQIEAKNKIHCFKLTTNMCKLEYITCPWL